MLRAVETTVRTDVGRQRRSNEDSSYASAPVFVVADGMGGAQAGEVASQMVVEAFTEGVPEDGTPEERLSVVVQRANREIHERSQTEIENAGMGTTVVGAMFSPRKRRMYIGHVGDSRCYRVRSGAIQLLTRDHSLINDYLLAMPDLTDEQRSELPKNVITRALGMQDQVVVDLQHDDPLANDVYILCSDGLSGMIPDEEIMKIVTSSPDIREGCKRLIARANESGGEDNITAVLIKIEETAVEKPIEPDGAAEGRVAAKAMTEAAGLNEEDEDPSFAEEPTMPGIQPDKPSRP